MIISDIITSKDHEGYIWILEAITKSKDSKKKKCWWLHSDPAETKSVSSGKWGAKPLGMDKCAKSKYTEKNRHSQDENDDNNHDNSGNGNDNEDVDDCENDNQNDDKNENDNY